MLSFIFQKQISRDILELRSLSTDQEFEVFSEKFETFTGIKYPFQYLRNSKAYGIYLGGSLISGFLLSEGDNIRWLSQVPADCPFLQNVDKSLLVEVNGVWMDTSIRKTATSLKVWTLICKTIANHGKSIPTFGYLTERKGLGNLYKNLSSGTVYQGQMVNSNKEITILYTNLFKVRHIKLLYAATFFKRSLARFGNNYAARALKPAISDVHFGASLANS